MFCNWDAEEYGLIGSTEWVQEHTQLLMRRAIAYLNVDNIHGNESLYAITYIHNSSCLLVVIRKI